MTIKAEVLLSIAQAHGIDLERAAKMAAKEKPYSDVVPGKIKGSRVLVTPPGNLAKGAETRSMRRPSWTVQEIGQAAAGLPEAPFKAALYAFAGAHEHSSFLHRELVGRAKMFAHIYSWPTLIRDFHGIQSPYLQHLCKMILDEDAYPVYFRAAPALYGIYLRVTPEFWEQRMQGYYAEIKHGIWNDWLGYAARMIQSKLSEHEE